MFLIGKELLPQSIYYLKQKFEKIGDSDLIFSTFCECPEKLSE